MKVAVTWEMCGFVEVPFAKTMEEAMAYVENNIDEIELPRKNAYVDGSLTLTTHDVAHQKILSTFTV